MKNINIYINELKRSLSQEEIDLAAYNSGYVDHALYITCWNNYEPHKKAAARYAYNNAAELDDIISEFGWEWFGSIEAAVKRLYIERMFHTALDNLKNSLAYYGLVYLRDYWDIKQLDDDFDVEDFGVALCDFETFERILDYLDEYALETKRAFEAVESVLKNERR